MTLEEFISFALRVNDNHQEAVITVQTGRGKIGLGFYFRDYSSMAAHDLAEDGDAGDWLEASAEHIKTVLEGE